jgi:hypothetical protein
MWALSVPNVKPVVLSPKTRVQPFVMPYNYNVCLGTRKSFIDCSLVYAAGGMFE